MIKFDKVQAGDVLYDVGRQKAGNTNMSWIVVWIVHVISVDLETRTAMCRWNGNPATRYSERRITRLRRSPPTGATAREAIDALAERADAQYAEWIRSMPEPGD